MKTCSQCKQEKHETAFSANATARDGLRAYCRTCGAAAARAWQAKNPEQKSETAKAWKAANRGRINEATFNWRKSETGAISEMLAQAKKRAKRSGLPFALTPADIDIPELCPVFRQPLIRKTGKGASPWSASLDKIIPAKGYVPGNVRVLSHKANLMKSSATLEELRVFADWILSQ